MARNLISYEEKQISKENAKKKNNQIFVYEYGNCYNF